MLYSTFQRVFKSLPNSERLKILILVVFLNTSPAQALTLFEAETEARQFLENWIKNRVIPGDESLDQNFQRLKKKYLALVNFFPRVEAADDLAPLVQGHFDFPDLIRVRKDLTSYQLTSTLVHEGTHYYDLSSPGDLMRPSHEKIIDRFIISFQKNWNEKQKADYDYIGTPEEMHARIMTLRWAAGFKPDQTVKLEDLNQFLKEAMDAGRMTPGALEFDSDLYDLKQISRDLPAIVEMLNLMVMTSIGPKNFA